jgi:hypothetical protein
MYKFQLSEKALFLSFLCRISLIKLYQNAACFLLFNYISLVLVCKVSKKKVKQYLLFSLEKPNVQYRICEAVSIYELPNFEYIKIKIKLNAIKLKLTVRPLSCQSLICDTKAAEHVQFL